MNTTKRDMREVMRDVIVECEAVARADGVPLTGVDELHGAEHDVIPDRIEAATFAIAAAATNGEICIKGARADHMHAVLDKLRECGVKS